MTTKNFCLSCLLCCLSATSFADEMAEAPAAPASAAAPAPAALNSSQVCLIQGLPAAGIKYTVLRKVTANKGTYGSVAEMLPPLASQALALGGSALINYNGGQRFGFWPWRMTHPVVTGTAIRWDGPAPDCVAAGGSTVAAVMSSNQEPKKINAQNAAAASAAATAASQAEQN